MNYHVVEYHYSLMCQFENAGNLKAALYHLRLMWEEKQNG